MADGTDVVSQRVPKSTNTCDILILSAEMRPIQIFVSIMIIFALISTLCAAFYACFGPPLNNSM